MTFMVALRDLSSKPCRLLVEEEVKIDFDNMDPQRDLNDDETEQGVLRRFVQRASRVTLPHDNVDVYIGWWLDQGTIEIPNEFFNLIAKKKWKVTLDIND